MLSLSIKRSQEKTLSLLEHLESQTQMNGATEQAVGCSCKGDCRTLRKSKSCFPKCIAKNLLYYDELELFEYNLECFKTLDMPVLR